jgi:hypothetical protein
MVDQYARLFELLSAESGRRVGTNVERLLDPQTQADLIKNVTPRRRALPKSRDSGQCAHRRR